jgi:hypothetical protein
MTTTTPPRDITTPPPAARLWSTRPGWGISADLTPPELVNSRELKLLRKWLACYAAAKRKNSAQSASLSQLQAQTRVLQAQKPQYAAVIQIQGAMTQVQDEIATLMAGDVDLVALMGSLRSSLPSTMTIASESVTISLAAVASAPGATSGLDTSGLARIGTVTLSGGGATLDDISAYVDKLKVLPGVVDVVPTSNAADASGVRYTLSLGLTSALISHRFKSVAPVSK